MASLGPLYPTSETNSSVTPEDKDAWAFLGNAGADDGVATRITALTFDSADISQRLMLTGFGFTVPTGATIDGIVVEIERRAFAGGAKDYRVQLLDAGAIVGSNKATATAWPTTATVATYGTSTDLWGATWTAATVNATDFGLALSAEATAANTDIDVDFVRITVYYTEAPASQTVEPALLGGSTIFAPTVAPGSVSVSPALLGGAQIFTPTFRLQVSPALLGGAQVFAPTFRLTTAPSLLGGAQLFAPTFRFTVTPTLLGGGQVFAPTVAAGSVTVAVSLLGGGQVFAPTVTAIAPGAQTVTPALLGGGQVFAPTVAAGSVTVAVSLLGGANLFTPSVSPPVASVVPSMLGGAQLFAPTFRFTVTPALLGGGQVFAPTVAAGSVSVTVALLGGASLFTPTVAPGSVSVTPDLLGGATLYAPTVEMAGAQTPGTATVSDESIFAAIVSDEAYFTATVSDEL